MTKYEQVRQFLIGEKIKKLKAEQKVMEVRLFVEEAKRKQAEYELRYNHNHDPKNGRFTSGTGLTGGGGSSKIDKKGNSAGVIANKPREELLKMIEKSNSLDKPIFAYDTDDNKFASNARKIAPKKGFYDVALHGTEISAEFFGTPINAADLAKIIKSRKDYVTGTPIRLFSCNTGNIKNTGNCFAQLLANELNVYVEAPNDIVYVTSKGEFYVGTPGNTELKPFWSRKY